MGSPGWPEFAFSTASIDRKRIVLTDLSTSSVSVVLPRVSTAAEARIGMGTRRRAAELTVIEETDLMPDEGREREDSVGMESWLGKEERERTACEVVREEEEAIALSLCACLLLRVRVCNY